MDLCDANEESVRFGNHLSPVEGSCVAAIFLVASEILFQPLPPLVTGVTTLGAETTPVMAPAPVAASPCVDTDRHHQPEDRVAQQKQQLQAALGFLQQVSERDAPLLSAVTTRGAGRTLVATQSPVASFLGVDTRTPGRLDALNSEEASRQTGKSSRSLTTSRSAS